MSSFTVSWPDQGHEGAEGTRCIAVAKAQQPDENGPASEGKGARFRKRVCCRTHDLIAEAPCHSSTVGAPDAALDCCQANSGSYCTVDVAKPDQLTGKQALNADAKINQTSVRTASAACRVQTVAPLDEQRSTTTQPPPVAARHSPVHDEVPEKTSWPLSGFHCHMLPSRTPPQSLRCTLVALA